MQKARRIQYASAGVQGMPGIRMNVRSNVRLPDSEAGCTELYDHQPFYAGRAVPVPRRHLTVPARGAALFLCALAVLFGAMILSRMSVKAGLSRDRSAMEDAIRKTLLENEDLKTQVAEARDQARICYAAMQSLGMISSSGVESVPVVARNTRPGQTVSAAANSPSSLPEGIITGSR
ncbi:MAG: hypothetical protein J5472_02715 [Clostridia bacterium]|nr:hypothetical protein [Clostridia bacterium]